MSNNKAAVHLGEIQVETSIARAQSHKTISNNFKGLTKEKLRNTTVSIMIVGVGLGIVLALIIGSSWNYGYGFLMGAIAWLIISFSAILVERLVSNRIGITPDDEAVILDPPDLIERIELLLSKKKINQEIAEAVLGWRRGFLTYLVKVKHGPGNVVVNAEYISIDPDQVSSMVEKGISSGDIRNDAWSGGKETNPKGPQELQQESEILKSHVSSPGGKKVYIDAFETKGTEIKEGKVRKQMGNLFIFVPSLDKEVFLDLAYSSPVYNPDDPEYFRSFWDPPYLAIIAGQIDDEAWTLSSDPKKVIFTYSLGNCLKSKNINTSFDEYAKNYRKIQFVLQST